MSWRFPRRLPKLDDAMDSEDIDDAFLPIVEEMGTLNAHNFGASMGSGLTPENLGPSVAMRVASVGVYKNCSSAHASAATPGYVVVPSSGLWEPVGLSSVVVTESEDLFVMGSVQLSTYEPANGVLAAPEAHDMFVQLGVRVDGALASGTVVGDQDTYDEGHYMETGATGAMFCMETSKGIKVPAGSHTIEIVARVHTWDKNNATTVAKNVHVFSRELIIIEVH